MLHGLIAPSLKDSRGLGTTRSRSTPIVRPNPRHSGQAPNGLLKEKRFGVGGGMGAAFRQVAQARSALNHLMMG